MRRTDPRYAGWQRCSTHCGMLAWCAAATGATQGAALLFTRVPPHGARGEGTARRDPPVACNIAWISVPSVASVTRPPVAPASEGTVRSRAAEVGLPPMALALAPMPSVLSRTDHAWATLTRSARWRPRPGPRALGQRPDRLPSRNLATRLKGRHHHRPAEVDTRRGSGSAQTIDGGRPRRAKPAPNRAGFW